VEGLTSVLADDDWTSSSSTAAAGPGGSLTGGLIAWGVFLFLFTLVFTAWLVRVFARPKTPMAIFVITYLAWLCAFSIVFLIPLDVAKDAGTSLEGVWNVLFWLGFICTWCLLPMVQEYYDNGGFTFKHKLLLACKQNGILICIALTLVIILVVYLKVSKGLDASGIGVSRTTHAHPHVHLQTGKKQTCTAPHSAVDHN
jgi:hypothetical protein